VSSKLLTTEEISVTPEGSGSSCFIGPGHKGYGARRTQKAKRVFGQRGTGGRGHQHERGRNFDGAATANGRVSTGNRADEKRMNAVPK